MDERYWKALIGSKTSFKFEPTILDVCYIFKDKYKSILISSDNLDENNNVDIDCHKINDILTYNFYSDDLNYFSKLICEIRKSYGLSLNEMSYILNVSIRTITNWEKGTNIPKYRNFIEFVNIFKLNILIEY